MSFVEILPFAFGCVVVIIAGILAGMALHSYRQARKLVAHAKSTLAEIEHIKQDAERSRDDRRFWDIVDQENEP